MAILHKNISAEGDIHNPKWFSGANNGDVAWRNELGVLESTDELVLPAALNFVDGSAAPPTSNSGDIYVLSSGASVNAGWGTVALGDWVRYDGTTWNVITPQKSTLCYNETTDKLFSYDGSAWSGLGGGSGTDADAVHVNVPSEISGIAAKATPTSSDLLIIEDVADSNNKKKITIGDLPSSGGGGNTIYTADDTVGASRVATLTDTLRFKSGIVEIEGTGTNGSSLLSLYDGQGTPVKLWDFLDNGNINLGSNSVINQDSNVLQFSNINSIGGLKFNGTSNNGIGLNLANGTNDFDFVVAGSSNTNIGTGSLGLLTGNTWKVQITQTGKVSIGSNLEPITGYDLSVQGGIRTNGQLRAITSLVGNNATAIAGYDLVVDNKASFGNEFAIVSPAGTMQFNGYRAQNTVPNTATFPNDKDLGIHKNTSTGVISLAYNNGGTIVSVQLT